ncbi:hypothetical protein SDC9_100817 [bioreactor metagenome]|uniref:Uncharacterized protein n=1 Tax=bioreactor metagenome TaxID=1076179 RepID=A0A645AWY0_9ZZZZ
MVANDVVHLRMVDAGAHTVEMEEPVVFGRAGRVLEAGQQIVQFHAQKRRVYHAPLGGSGMYAEPPQLNIRARGVKALVVDFTEFAAVHRVAKIRVEARYVEEIHAPANFLVRRKRNADRAVFRRVGGEQAFAERHDLGNAGFVVRTQKRSAVRADDLLAEMLEQFRVGFRREHVAVAHVDLPAVVVRRQNGFYVRAGDRVHRVHMRQQTDGRNGFGRVCGNGSGNVAVAVQLYFFRAQLEQFVNQKAGKVKLLFRTWEGFHMLNGLRVNFHIA